MIDKNLKRKFKLFFKWASLAFFLISYIVLHYEYGIKARNTFAMFAGALGMFVFGMNMMSASLQRIAGNKLKTIISSLTNSPFTGMLTGVAVTAIIQSSSATTVMTVGFVNAGLMSLQQGIRIILGANIGTTVTAQLIAFKFSDLAWPMLAVGSAMIVFCKSRRNRSWGETILGFALLFLGMKFMGDSLKAYRDHELFKTFFIVLSQNRFLGVVAGLFVTLIVQSSSATVGLTMSLMAVGAFGDDPSVALRAAVPIVLGVNIGTCVTASLASIGASRNAKRVALAHVLFNLCGTLLVLPFLDIYCRFIEMTSSDPVRQAANAHTVFNITNGLIFLPFSLVLERVVLFFVPITEEDAEPVGSLDKRIMTTPPIAIGQAEDHLKQAMSLVAKMFGTIEKVLSSRGNNLDDFSDLIKKIEGMQKNREQITAELNKFLVALAQKDLTEDLYQQLTRLLYLNKDLEIVTSQLQKLVASLYEQFEEGRHMSVEAQDELLLYFTRVTELFRQLAEGLDCPLAQNEKIRQAIYSETLLASAARNNHIERIKDSRYDPVESVVFLDALRSISSMLGSFDHMSSHFKYHF